MEWDRCQCWTFGGGADLLRVDIPAKCHEILRDLVSFIGWRHPIHKTVCKYGYNVSHHYVCAVPQSLTHWGRVTHICVSKLAIIGSDNGLSPGRRQAIIRNNAGLLLIGPLGTNLSEFLVVIHTFSFNKMHLKMSSAKWRPFCLGLNVLIAMFLRVWHDSFAPNN